MNTSEQQTTETFNIYLQLKNLQEFALLQNTKKSNFRIGISVSPLANTYVLMQNFLNYVPH
jgi:hypothetical protein